MGETTTMEWLVAKLEAEYEKVGGQVGLIYGHPVTTDLSKKALIGVISIAMSQYKREKDNHQQYVDFVKNVQRVIRR
jgi:hypothetical protein